MFTRHDEKGAKSADPKGALIIDYDLAKCRDILSNLDIRVSDYATTDKFYEEYELALYEYFEGRNVLIDDEDASDEFFRDEEEFDRFMSWYSLYFVTDGQHKTFPALYLQRHRYQLSPLEEEMLKSYVRSFLSLYEVQHVDPGRGFELQDLLTGKGCWVEESSLSRFLCKWDVIYAGLVSGKGWTFLGGFEILVIPPRLKGYLERTIREMFEAEREECGSLEEFLRSHSSAIGAVIEKALDECSEESLRNSEGDLLCLATLHYRIADPAALIEKIEASPFFSRGSQRTAGRNASRGETYTWIRQAGKGLKIFETPPLGVLRIEKNKLRAECNSRERAGRLRALLEDHFGSLLHYTTTIYEDPDVRVPLWAGLQGEDSAAEVGYKNWFDEEVPALGGMTPREAAATPDGRERLIELLKELENENEKVLRMGLKNDGFPIFPVDKIRKELGL